MDDELFPVMSRERWLNEGSRSDLAYLSELTLLHDRDPFGAWTQWKSMFGPVDLDVRLGPKYSSSDLVLRAAAEGLGIALGRARLAEHDLRSGLLVRPCGERALPLPNAYWIVMADERLCRSAVQTFVDWLNVEASKQERCVSPVMPVRANIRNGPITGRTPTSALGRKRTLAAVLLAGFE